VDEHKNMTLPGMMRGIFYLGPEKLELRQVPIPAPQAGELLVKVVTATTCGTDLKTYRRGHPKFPPPFLFGHEFAGDVAAVGEDVDNFKPGMRVTANVFAPCGLCFYCLKGQDNLCEALHYNFGAFAEYMIIPASIVRSNTFLLPDDLSYAHAALLEPLVSVVHGQRRIAIQPGEKVAIIGAGGAISLLHLQMAQLAGAAKIMGIGHSDLRLETFAQLGASEVINARHEPALERVLELTFGRGADVVIECAGTKEAWESAVHMVRKGGRVLWFGGLPAGTTVQLDAAMIHYGEITLIGVHGGTLQDAQEAYRLLVSGEVDPGPLISGEYPLEEIEDAFQQMIAGTAIKLVIRP
jgi:L-iditol 2-dehydrogenase